MAIAVVTGSSSGIGQATAVSLARAGHIVYATMRNPKAGSEELRAIAERESLQLRYAALDVDSDKSVREAFDSIVSEAGPVDVLVNNAGIGLIGAVEELPLAAFRASMETNFFGALHSGCRSQYERETFRMHRQRYLGCRSILCCPASAVRIFKVRA